MRTPTKLMAATAVLLAMAGCTSGAKPAPPAPQGSAGSTDAVSTEAAAAGDFENQPAQSNKKHLLAEEGGYKFYSLVPADPEDGRLCVIVQSEGGAEGVGCSDSIPYVGTGVEITNLVEAKLVFPGYNASKDLVDGWRYLHNNLLVRGLDDLKSSS